MYEMMTPKIQTRGVEKKHLYCIINMTWQILYIFLGVPVMNV